MRRIPDRKKIVKVELRIRLKPRRPGLTGIRVLGLGLLLLGGRPSFDAEGDLSRVFRLETRVIAGQVLGSGSML